MIPQHLIRSGPQNPTTVKRYDVDWSYQEIMEMEDGTLVEFADYVDLYAYTTQIEGRLASTNAAYELRLQEGKELAKENKQMRDLLEQVRGYFPSGISTEEYRKTKKILAGINSTLHIQGEE